jgi:hypothetical protein
MAGLYEQSHGLYKHSAARASTLAASTKYGTTVLFCAHFCINFFPFWSRIQSDIYRSGSGLAISYLFFLIHNMFVYGVGLIDGFFSFSSTTSECARCARRCRRTPPSACCVGPWSASGRPAASPGLVCARC